MVTCHTAGDVPALTLPGFCSAWGDVAKSRVAVTHSVVGSLLCLVPVGHRVSKGFLKTKKPTSCLKDILCPTVRTVEAFLQAKSKSVHRGVEHWGEGRSWSWTEMEAEFLLIKKCQ